MKPLVPLFLFLSAVGLSAQQSASTRQPIPLPVWKAPVDESQGAYTVSLNSICSVALEHYDLQYKDQTYPIVECSLETVGGKTARFYYIDDREDSKKSDDGSALNQVKEAVKTLIPSEEEEDEKKKEKLRVVKVYPESALTTTVEYRLATEAEIVRLYNSLRDAWVSSAP